MRRLLLALPLLAGCPTSETPGEPTVVYAFEGDVLEQEPNDSPEQAQDLGTPRIPHAVTGSASACGSNGTLEGADTDWLLLRPANGAALWLALDMWEGDLDLAVVDAAGEVVAESDTPGVDDEALLIALDPQEDWLLRIRCAAGNPGALWRLRIAAPTPTP